MTDIGPKRPTVERTVFSTPRSAEFLELRALQAQTGQHADAFGHVVVKELLDNALDAAETAGRAPVIEIATRTDEYREITFVTVTDNGAGITSEVVARLCDFTMLVSDKARYRGPTRGAQGNAFKTVLGIPFALDVNEPVVIESEGVRHALQVTLNRVGDVVVVHDETVSDRTLGTSVTVPLPANLDIKARRWAYNAALVNPHADISVVIHGYSDDGSPTKPAFFTNPQVRRGRSGCRRCRRRRTGTTCPRSRRWSTAISGRPNTPGKTCRSVASSPSSTALSGSAKQRAIRAVVPGVTHLSGLEGRDDLIAALHDAMLDHAKPTQPKRLGPVGKDHLRRMLNGYGVRDLWYKSTEIVDDDGIPWVIEVAVADTAKPGGVWFGCNHSPAFNDPLGRTELEEGDVWAEGVRSFLEEADIKPGSHHAVVVHVICAAAEFMDKGKVTLVVPDTVADWRREGAARRHQNAAEGGRAAPQGRP